MKNSIEFFLTLHLGVALRASHFLANIRTQYHLPTSYLVASASLYSTLLSYLLARGHSNLKHFGKQALAVKGTSLSVRDSGVRKPTPSRN